MMLSSEKEWEENVGGVDQPPSSVGSVLPGAVSGEGGWLAARVRVARVVVGGLGDGGMLLCAAALVGRLGALRASGWGLVLRQMRVLGDPGWWGWQLSGDAGGNRLAERGPRGPGLTLGGLVPWFWEGGSMQLGDCS